MNVDELLRELGAMERTLRDIEQGPGAPSMPGDACWPAWRVLLHKSNEPELFETWRQTHGSSCPACRGTLQRVESDTAPSEHDTSGEGSQEVRILFDALCAKALPWAAATSTLLQGTGAELPLAQYHQLRDVTDPALHAVWCVTWDNTLFIILVGPKNALTTWQQGALLVNRQGARICELKPAPTEMRELLAPDGVLDDREALCLQSQLSVADLQKDSFSIPELLAGAVRLLPVASGPSAIQELITDLASRNRIVHFLANLPATVADPAEALTLSLYLRLLFLQDRLTGQEKARLMRFEWLARDLREVFSTSGGSQE